MDDFVPTTLKSSIVTQQEEAPVWPEQDDLDAAMRGDHYPTNDVRWARKVLAMAAIVGLVLAGVYFAFGLIPA